MWDKYKKRAVEAAKLAGAYIEKHAASRKTVRYKGEMNVVTNVDTAAEAIIVETIKKYYPGHAFIAEEKIYKEKNPDFTWIIDPLDGTTNFLHGFPFFSVSLALSYRGSVIIGVVYDPLRKELFLAEKAKGAFLNKKRIYVSKVREIKKALIATGFAYDMQKARQNNIANFSRFLRSSQAVRRAGSAALDLCYVASGRFDGFWEFYLNPWDTAAGVLIVEEAGGKATKTDGSEYTIYDKDLLVSNSKIHSQMVKILSKP